MHACLVFTANTTLSITKNKNDFKCKQQASIQKDKYGDDNKENQLK